MLSMQLLNQEIPRSWVFRSNDGKIRYVSLEGDGETLKTILPMVESSWSNTKAKAE